MILKLDKSNVSWGVILIPLFAIVVSIPIFFNEINSIIYFYDWQNLFFNFINEVKIANFILTLSFLIVNSVLINQVFSRTNLFSKATYVPALLYIVFVTFVDNLFFSPFLIIHLLLIGLVDQLMKLDKGSPAINIAFKSALLIGLMTCLSFYHGVVSLAVFLALYSIKSFNWREWFLVLLGVSIPLLYLFSSQFIFSDRIDIGTMIGQYNIDYQIHLIHYVQLTCFLLIIVTGVGPILKFYSHNTALSKKRLSILFTLFLIILGLFFIGYYLFGQIDYSWIVPLVFLLGASIKSNQRDSLVSLLLTIALVVNIVTLFMS